MWMTKATEGSGVFVTGAVYGHSQALVEALGASWSSNGPKLEIAGLGLNPHTSWPYARGNAGGQNSTGRRYFPTADKTAVIALQEWNPVSILVNHEFAGRICAQNGRFFATHPNTEPQFSDTVTASDCPTGIPWVAHYHTHGTWGNNGLSDPDKTHADANPGKAWYVGTPCGWIVKYVGPNGVQNSLADRTETTARCSE